MYLSRIKLNTQRRDTMRALVAPSIFHGAIESCDDDRNRKLWRIDTLNDEKYMLILSENALDFTPVGKQFGYDKYECKSYENFLSKIKKGSVWRFRLKANPTIQKYDNKTGRGKVYAHITPNYQYEWLKKQSVKNGFNLNEDCVQICESRWYYFKKNKNERNNIKILAITFEGELIVTDVEVFKNALITGIGREKAYGMGLLTITGV